MLLVFDYSLKTSVSLVLATEHLKLLVESNVMSLWRPLSLGHLSNIDTSLCPFGVHIRTVGSTVP